jgi:hypothetical protein
MLHVSAAGRTSQNSRFYLQSMLLWMGGFLLSLQNLHIALTFG